VLQLISQFQHAKYYELQGVFPPICALSVSLQLYVLQLCVALAYHQPYAPLACVHQPCVALPFVRQLYVHQPYVALACIHQPCVALPFVHQLYVHQPCVALACVHQPYAPLACVHQPCVALPFVLQQ